MEILQPVIEFLVSAFMFDMMVFSNMWLYIPLLIPALFYFTFFILKWTVITAPIWLPFSIIFGSIKKDKNEK